MILGSSISRNGFGGALTGALVSLTFVLISVCLLLGCDDRSTNTKEINPQEAEVAEEFTLTQTFEGKKAWVLKARSATSMRDDNMIRVYDPHLDFYSREGDIYSTLVSDSGIYYLESSNIKALGQVIVVSADSAVLRTDSLKWVSGEKEIRTEGRVHITKGTTVITGEGLVSDPALDHIKIERDFRAETQEAEPSDSLR